jgi:hypothetical protein
VVQLLMAGAGRRGDDAAAATATRPKSYSTVLAYRNAVGMPGLVVGEPQVHMVPRQLALPGKTPLFPQGLVVFARRTLLLVNTT